MNRIYSKVQPGKILLAISRGSSVSEERTDLSPEEEYLQVSTKILPKGKTFRPHKHNELIRNTDLTQEAWVFLSGKVKATFWDLDDTVIYETQLTDGDIVVVFRGGHSFEVLEDNTILYEFKNGPYYGVEKDKTFIK